MEGVSLYIFFTQSPRVEPVQRIITDVSIQIQAGKIAERVGLQEPADFRPVIPEAVIIQPGLSVFKELTN